MEEVEYTSLWNSTVDGNLIYNHNIDQSQQLISDNSNNNTTIIPLCFPNKTTKPTNDPINDLYPAIIECFGIILLGYIAGRFHIITHSQAQGIGSYLTKFALPALLFSSMTLMNFDIVNWTFIASIFVIKGAVFFLVMILVALTTKPVNYGKIGIYSIFVTQSNDIALGFPIVQALYAGSHPEFTNYIYLIQPINLIILNPIAFVFLEIYKWKRLPVGDRKSKIKAVFTVVKGIILNPIVFMTAFGVVGNFVFKQHLPRSIRGLITTLAESFPALALFYLGHEMNGKMSNQNKKSVITVTLLLCAKMLLMPVIAREITTWMLSLHGYPDSRDLASLAFLYGTFPAAPVVFLFACSYGVAKNVIATGVVAGTFLCGPLMFVTAKVELITASKWVPGALLDLITGTANDLSYITMFCAVWVLCVLVLGRRITSLPHQFTACLTVFQILKSIFLILYLHLGGDCRVCVLVFYTLYMVCVAAARSSMVMIAVAVCAIGTRSLCYLLRRKLYLYMFIFGFPVFCTGLVWAFSYIDKRQVKSGSPEHIFFPFGKAQLCVVILNIVVNVGIALAALIFYHRRDRDSIWGTSHHTSMADHNHRYEQSDEQTVDTSEGVNHSDTEALITATNGSVHVNNSHVNPTQEISLDSSSREIPLPDWPTTSLHLTYNAAFPSPGGITGILRANNSTRRRKRKKRVTLSTDMPSSGSTSRPRVVKHSCVRCRSGVLCSNPCDDIEDLLSTMSRTSTTPSEHYIPTTQQQLTEEPTVLNLRQQQQEDSGGDIQTIESYGITSSTEACINSTSVSDNVDLNSLSVGGGSTVNNRGVVDDDGSLCQLRSFADEQVLSSGDDLQEEMAENFDVEEYMCCVEDGDESTCICDRSPEGQCQKALKTYLKRRFYFMNEEERLVAGLRDEHQLVRHIVLVIMLMITAVSELLLCIWRLSNKNGLYVELEFINMIIVTGQGVFTFTTFGFDTEMVLNPLLRKLRKLIKGSGDIPLPEYADLDDETKKTAETFRDYYIDSCRQDIARCHWYKLRRYQCTFFGHELVDWIIDRALASEREDAVDMGSRLLEGCVIEHVQREQYFQDLPYLYQFVKSEERMQ